MHVLCVHILTTRTDLILRRGCIGVSIISIVTPDVIRGPERQARLMRVALDTRLREYDGDAGSHSHPEVRTCRHLRHPGLDPGSRAARTIGACGPG